jgi:hypothetical protein
VQHKKYSISGKNIKTINLALKKETAPIIEEHSKSGKTFFFIFEKYSFIQDSDMTVTLFIDVISEKECALDCIVSGGKSGLFQLDLFDREHSVLEKTHKIIEKMCEENHWNLLLKDSGGF